MSDLRTRVNLVGIKYAAIIAVVIAMSNLLWVLGYFGSMQQSIAKSIEQGGTGYVIPVVLWRHILIETALIASAIGLLFRNVAGLVVSLLGLTGVGVIYVWWYLWTQGAIENAGLSRLPAGAQVGGLAGATGWNLVVLTIVFLLIVWQAVLLVNVLRSVRTLNNSVHRE